MHSRVLPAKNQWETFLDRISFIIEYTPKANHNYVLVFAVVGCISPHPKWMVNSIRRNISYLCIDFLQVVPVTFDLSIRNFRP